MPTAGPMKVGLWASRCHPRVGHETPGETQPGPLVGPGRRPGTGSRASSWVATRSPETDPGRLPRCGRITQPGSPAKYRRRQVPGRKRRHADERFMQAIPALDLVWVGWS